MAKKLFIPGPTQVHPDVLAKMASPMISHRGKDASNLQRNIAEKMQQVLYTKNKIVLSTTSGTGLMEGVIRSCTEKRAIVFSVGAFGDRWGELAKLNNIPVDVHRENDGEPTMPQTVDKYLATGKYDVVTITHNETSSGIMNPVGSISEIIAKYPDVLFLMDTVSSAAGEHAGIAAIEVQEARTSTANRTAPIVAVGTNIEERTTAEDAEARHGQFQRRINRAGCVDMSPA